MAVAQGVATGAVSEVHVVDPARRLTRGVVGLKAQNIVLSSTAEAMLLNNTAVWAFKRKRIRFLVVDGEDFGLHHDFEFNALHEKELMPCNALGLLCHLEDAGMDWLPIGEMVTVAMNPISAHGQPHVFRIFRKDTQHSVLNAIPKPSAVEGKVLVMTFEEHLHD